MWEQIGAAAIYGAIGGGGGAVLGVALGKLFSRFDFSNIITSVLALIGMVVGYNFAEPLLKPHIGQYMPQPATLDGQLEAALQELHADPLMAAIHKKEPQLETELRSRLAEIMAEHDDPREAQKAAFLMAHGRVSSRLNHYLPRATDTDLISFNRHMVSVLRYLSAADPTFCHQFLYDPVALAQLSVEDIQLKMGKDRHKRQQQLGAAVVANAFDEVPPYDMHAAEAQIAEGRKLLASHLGASRMNLIAIGGGKPATREDAAAACDGTARLLQNLLDSDHASAALRRLYGG